MLLQRLSLVSSATWATASWYVSVNRQLATSSSAIHHTSSLSIRRRYTSESKDNTFDGSIQPDDSVNDATMARYNILTRRLYRTLLRTCRTYNGKRTNNTAADLSISIDDTDNGILLQPTMDPRLYGYANIVTARSGYDGSDRADSWEILGYNNCAAVRMSEIDVKTAMEVLRFTHEQMGGDPDDDLCEYYLGISCSADENNNDKKVKKNENIQHTFASAGQHSEGHYTQFIDDDPEQGRGFVNCNDKGETIVDEWDSSDDDDDMSVHDKSVLVTYNDLQNAIRISFRGPIMPSYSGGLSSSSLTTSTVLARRQRDAIDACSRLSEQIHNWNGKSSISINQERGLRVVATSSIIRRPVEGSSVGMGTMGNYGYIYRIRVENISDIIDNYNNTSPSSNVEQSSRRNAVQLLGRRWIISEKRDDINSESITSKLKRVLEEGVTEEGVYETRTTPSIMKQIRHHQLLMRAKDGTEEDADMKGEEQSDPRFRVVQTVNEPWSGAVGHFPVIRPGEVFEYMSGTDLSTPSGCMEGCFHMALVDVSTNSAQMGEDVEALKWKSNDIRKFEMPIGMFGLTVDEDVER